MRRFHRNEIYSAALFIVLMDFRNALVEKTRTDAVEKVSGSSSSLGKEDESELMTNEQMENTRLCEERERTMETSFKHLRSDYNVDWKDTRRYPADGSSAPHRKLCVSLIASLGHYYYYYY